MPTRYPPDFQKNKEILRLFVWDFNAATREILIHPHEHPEVLPLGLLEHKPPVHHPRHTMVNRRLHPGFYTVEFTVDVFSDYK